MKVRLVGLVALMALVLASCGGTSPEAADGQSEGIQVHGDWTIDIYNDDGSLDSSVEFKNALSDRSDGEGAGVLSSLLRGAYATEFWSVSMYSDVDKEVCVASTGAPRGVCEIWEEPGTDVPSISHNLQVGGTTSVLLEGSIQASLTGEISSVNTKVETCQSVTSGNCPAGQGGFVPQFTVTDVGPIAVEAGQIIQLQVEFSFGSG